MIYLDHQASTPMHPAALTALLASIVEHNANPHASEHAAGWKAADAVDVARQALADAIRADADEIVFTSGATEANNLAIFGVSDASCSRNRIVVSAIEHKAVLGPARELARRGFEVVFVPVCRNGMIDADRLKGLINERTLLVSLMLVNNETGVVQPVAEAALAAAAVGALLHVDAAQALGWITIDAHASGADMISMSGHKMGGPKGIGALWVRREIRKKVKPLLHGGEQEDGLRPGTLPTPLCVGFGEACRHISGSAEIDQWRQRTTRLETALLAMLPGAVVNGSQCYRHPGTISLTTSNLDADSLVAMLQPHVAISRGSACTSGIPEPSHVLRAMGLTAAECARTLRISTGRTTTDEEITFATEHFRDATSRYNRERQQAA
ncbi:IscS subfamily cysteine desulfurase [Sphingomonas swuensis]|uniref:Cysteine desulfurase n=1 Tax=Sphingomonas swuensis TaxID=977800 RepID=A0ABP7T0H0_9SPHN